MLHKIIEHQAAVEAELLALPNVVGVGAGVKYVGSNMTERLVLKIFVKAKSNLEELGSNAVPDSYRMADGTVIYTDVVEVGDMQFYSFNDRYDPAKPGVSSGIEGLTIGQGGTLGAVVTDDLDGNDVMIGSGQAWANWQTGPIGANILQPAEAFGGSAPNDVVGTLKRFTTLTPGLSGNNVCNIAVASITAARISGSSSMCGSINLKKNNAVAAILAGGAAFVLLSPINEIEGEMDISFNKKTNPSVGMEIKKCGGATEYSEAVIADTNVTMVIGGPDGNTYRFVNQATISNSGLNVGAGDSGAIFYQKGGKKGKGF